MAHHKADLPASGEKKWHCFVDAVIWTRPQTNPISFRILAIVKGDFPVKVNDTIIILIYALNCVCAVWPDRHE